MNKKLFSAAAVLALAAGSAFAAPNGSIWTADPSFDVAAQAGKATRADVNAQAVLAQRDARAIYAAADGNLDVTGAKAAPVVSREQVKAETLQALRVSGYGAIATPY